MKLEFESRTPNNILIKKIPKKKKQKLLKKNYLFVISYQRHQNIYTNKNIIKIR